MISETNESEDGLLCRLCYGLYFVSLCLSNLLAHKVWGSGWFVLSAGTLPIPITYLILNIVTYTKSVELSNKLVIAGVVIELIFAFDVYVSSHIGINDSLLQQGLTH